MKRATMTRPRLSARSSDDCQREDLHQWPPAIAAAGAGARKEWVHAWSAALDGLTSRHRTTRRSRSTRRRGRHLPPRLRHHVELCSHPNQEGYYHEHAQTHWMIGQLESSAEQRFAHPAHSCRHAFDPGVRDWPPALPPLWPPPPLPRSRAAVAPRRRPSRFASAASSRPARAPAIACARRASSPTRRRPTRR